MGQRAFEVSIQVEIDQDTVIGHPSMYDPKSDRAKIFVNGVRRSVEAGADAFRLVEQAVAHEFGHAREARLFARHRVFPWHCVTYGYCFIDTEAGRLPAKNFLSGFAHLTNVMQDFAIDRELSKYGVKDHT